MNQRSLTAESTRSNQLELIASPVGRVLTQADADMGSGTNSSYLERLIISIMETAPVVDWQGWRGNLVVSDDDLGAVHLACHPAGTYPLYYLRDSDGADYSPRLAEFSTGRRADWVGCIEFLLYGYQLNGRSLLDGVSQVRPGEILRRRKGESAWRGRDASPLWRSTAPPSAEDVLEIACDVLKDTMGRVSTDDSAIMMSGGWDSRTLLAAVAPDTQIRLFSHGNTEGRELRIVRDLARRSSLATLLRRIDREDFSCERLVQGFIRTGNVLFPNYHRSAGVMSEAGVNSAVTGIYGEVFGGHYGPSMISQGPGKGLDVFRKLLRVKHGRLSFEDAARRLQDACPRGKPWYVTEEFWRSSAWKKVIEADIAADIERLIDRGIEDPDLLLEAFICEHRGAQYIGQQPRSLQPLLGTVDPFTDVRLLAPVTSLPLASRVHNTLNRRLLVRLAPHLLKAPTAACLISAGRPILMQELSRAVRKGGEQLGKKLGLQGAGLSWIDYEFLRRSSSLSDVADTLQAEIWDYAEIRRRLDMLSRGEGSCHSTAEMLMKIATVDWTITHRKQV